MLEPPPKDHLLAIGINTGNSLDAADVVLTAFHDEGMIKDLAFYSLPFSEELYTRLKNLRHAINNANGDMAHIAAHYPDFEATLNAYMDCVIAAVHGLIKKAKQSDIPDTYDLDHIDLIGFHGQTCAHLPPSVAQDGATPYTVQIGDGQRLADETGITTIYDFRSDDIMNGGEGAPLAPMHNKHIAQSGVFPITFINSGNTSNLAHITKTRSSNDIEVVGWDAGPFNHLPDMFARKYLDMPCDQDGAVGKTGQVNQTLLEKLFDSVAVDQSETNFLLKSPPKSSDPRWYRMPDIVDDETIPVEDRLRTIEYLSAYIVFYSLGFTPDNLVMPSHFAVFGGGWKNPVIFEHFDSLLKNGTQGNIVIEKHHDWLADISLRLKNVQLAWSDTYGFDGQAMEARIFADMARCRISNIPFTNKQLTGTKMPSICGVIAYPKGKSEYATDNLLSRLSQEDKNEIRNHLKWNRASAGWQKDTPLFPSHSL